MGGCSTKDKKTEADTPPAPEKVDYDFESMTSKQLKALLTERGIDSSKYHHSPAAHTYDTSSPQVPGKGGFDQVPRSRGPTPQV